LNFVYVVIHDGVGGFGSSLVYAGVWGFSFVLVLTFVSEACFYWCLWQHSIGSCLYRCLW